MAITSAIANSFKVEILQGGHNFNDSSGAPTGNAFKISLYSSDSATLSKSTTAYTAPADGTADPTNTYEVTSSGDTACVKFNDISWTSASFTARGCLIYNSTAVTGFTTNRAVCAVNFGADKTVTSGTFTVQFPAQTAGNAIVQIA